MTETSGERFFIFYLLKSFILPLPSDWIILCPYGWMADYSVLQQQYEVEEKAGMAVSEIFKRHGEAYFRDLEHVASM